MTAGQWNARYFDEAKAWGANIVRFAIHPQAWRERGRDGYLALVDQGVEWARERDLTVILDWHSIGNLRTELYQSANYDTTQKETFEFWRTVSARYAGVSHPYPQKREQPWEIQWEADWGHVADTYPVMVTEFGFERGGHVPTDSGPEYGHAILDYMKKEGISWTAWCFDPNWDPTLIEDWDFTPTEQGPLQGRIARAATAHAVRTVSRDTGTGERSGRR